MSVSVDQWWEYSNRRNPSLFVFVGYVPVVFGIAMVTMHLFHRMTEIADNDLRAVFTTAKRRHAATWRAVQIFQLFPREIWFPRPPDHVKNLN